MVKILIGGSPCTFWSIAQHNSRETKAEGLGWELFKNYVIAKEKFQPDYFLYENNKSASQAIKDQIQEELGQELMYINSALVSAQNRQRFYVFNWEVKQPEDRKIYLRDILESAEYYQYQEEADRTGLTAVRVGQIDKGSQGDRIYSVEGKAVAMKAQGGGWGAKTGLYAVPVGIGYRNRREADGKLYRRFETHNEEKANAITTVATDRECQVFCVRGRRKCKENSNEELARHYTNGRRVPGTGRYLGASTIERRCKYEQHNSRKTSNREKPGLCGTHGESSNPGTAAAGKINLFRARLCSSSGRHEREE